MSLDQIKNLIIIGKTEEAIKQTQVLILESKSKLNKLSRELISLNARLTNINSEYRKGVIKNEERTIEVNKINDALISIVSELETKGTIADSNEEGRKKKKIPVIIGLILFTLSIAFAYNNWKSDSNNENAQVSHQTEKTPQEDKFETDYTFDKHNLIGLWKATNAFMNFKNGGKLEFVWHSGNHFGMKEIGSWELKNDTLVTILDDLKSTYKIAFINSNSFKFKKAFYESSEYYAKRTSETEEELRKFNESSKSSCVLENRKYRHRERYNDDFIQFYNRRDNIYEYSGKISIYSIGGTVNLNSDEVYFMTGNASGKLSLKNSCKSLIGSIKINESHHNKEAIDFYRNK